MNKYLIDKKINEYRSCMEFLKKDGGVINSVAYKNSEDFLYQTIMEIADEFLEIDTQYDEYDTLLDEIHQTHYYVTGKRN